MRIVGSDDNGDDGDDDDGFFLVVDAVGVVTGVADFAAEWMMVPFFFSFPPSLSSPPADGL